MLLRFVLWHFTDVVFFINLREEHPPKERLQLVLLQCFIMVVIKPAISLRCACLHTHTYVCLCSYTFLLER